jgi:hypothetical protein
MNIEHNDLCWFRPLHGGKSSTSDGLILKETCFTKGGQSARLVRV